MASFSRIQCTTSMDRLLQSDPHLKDLNLRHLQQSFENVSLLLAALKNNTTLERLWVCCKSVGAADRMLDLAQSLPPNLKALDLDLCQVSDSRLLTRVLSALRVNANLEELCVRFPPELGNEGIVALVGCLLPYLTKLESLDLRNNQIESDKIIALGRSDKFDMGMLKVLNLSFNRIADKGACAVIESLVSNGDSVLGVMDLSCNQLGEGTAKAVGRLLGLNRPSLEQVHLFCNQKIGESGAQYIRQGLERNDSVTSLSISGTGMNKSSMKMMEHLVKLNRAGRRILRSHGVPCGLWPLILSRVCHEPNVIFFFLSEMPHLIQNDQF